MKRITATLLLALTLISFKSNAAEPTCHTYKDGRPYCQYTGKVKQLYINSGNVILLYLDTRLDLNKASQAGFTGVTNTGAVAVVLNENPEFGKLFYSTALAAKAQDKEIILQLWGKYGGYLKADRIWLRE